MATKWKLLKNRKPSAAAVCLLSRKMCAKYIKAENAWLLDCITHGEKIPARDTDKWCAFKDINKLLT